MMEAANQNLGAITVFLVISNSIGEKKKNSSVCFVIFFSFYFLNAPIAITIEIQFMFFGIFWALLRAHFNPYLTAWAKMSLSLAQKKHFYACKHKLSVFNLGCVFASFTRNILF